MFIQYFFFKFSFSNRIRKKADDNLGKCAPRVEKHISFFEKKQQRVKERKKKDNYS